MNTRSLRLRVILGVLVVLVVVLGAAGVLVERVLAGQLRGDLEQRLVDRVGYGQLLSQNGLTGGDLADALSSASDGVRVVFQDDDGSTVVGVPQSPPVPGDGPGPAGPPGPRQHAPADVAKEVSLGSDDGGVTASIAVTGGRLVASASTYDIDQTLQKLRTVELAAGAAILLVVALLLTRVVAVALRPLSRMTALARRIAHGDRGGRLRPTNPNTELGRTAVAFDEMLASLEAAERDAQTAARSAREAEERMRRLLADVSHELRTPVAALQARAETLLRDNPPRERREELAVGMVRETRRAARLVDDLLLVNRLEQAPADQLRRRPLELAALTHARVDALDTPAIHLRAEGPVVVDGDPERLAQVLDNLLANAVRAAGDDGRVDVTVEGHGGTAVVEVADNGPGVPAAERERIFDRFVRLDTARGRGDGGSGLGLPISRALARAHGGDVVCLPAERGARFRVTLPVHAPSAPATTPTPTPALAPA